MENDKTKDQIIKEQRELIDTLNKENQIFRQYFIDINTAMLSEIEKDGWCRMVVSKEFADHMLEDIGIFCKDWNMKPTPNFKEENGLG